MKFNKRSADDRQTPQAAETGHADTGRSHILIYILILFIAAFLLMTLSFLSHQRSNEQVLGQLHTNVSSLQKLQSALEENVRLQEQMDVQRLQLEEWKAELSASQNVQEQLTEKISALEKSLVRLQTELDTLRQTASAIDALTQLQQLMISGDLTACRKIIADIETTGLDKLLPTTADTPGGLSPYQMYQQVKLLTDVPAGE